MSTIYMSQLSTAFPLMEEDHHQDHHQGHFQGFTLPKDPPILFPFVINNSTRQRRCVLSLETPHGLRWIVPEGSVFPLDAGSAGRVLSSTEAQDGWVESIGEREPGVASVSAAVAGPSGAVVAALSVSGPIERLSRQPGDRFGAAVITAAVELSRKLGG